MYRKFHKKQRNINENDNLLRSQNLNVVNNKGNKSIITLDSKYNNFEGEKYTKKKIKDEYNLAKKQKKYAKIKPITRIGNKTEIGKLLEKYSFLRTNTFSLKNLTNPEIEFDKKAALLLDILNDKEQKTKERKKILENENAR